MTFLLENGPRKLPRRDVSMNSATKTVFVTGGSGYIGSHCVLQLLKDGYTVVTCDDGSNSKRAAIKKVEEISGKKVYFHQYDLCNIDELRNIFSKHKIDYVIHFAASKNVGESVKFPFLYYKNNLKSTINLLEVMEENEVFQLVFSSSCSVYGNAKVFPIKESHPIGQDITSPYGRSKYFIEQMLIDITKADTRWNVISLRYFNPIGADPSGHIGENNTKIYTNLLPLISQVAIGQRKHLTIFGGDYNTPDGTAIRDYIHISDLISGHIMALTKIQKEHVRYKAYNLGLGKGLTVLELVKEFENICGKKVAYEIADRREGDVERLVCDTSLAAKELGWYPKFGVKDMCEDFWRWQTLNPKGYPNSPH